MTTNQKRITTVAVLMLCLGATTPTIKYLSQEETANSNYISSYSPYKYKTFEYSNLPTDNNSLSKLSSDDAVMAPIKTLRHKRISKKINIKIVLSSPVQEKTEPTPVRDTTYTEQISENNNTIERKIFVRDGIKTVYTKVVHSWGGIYYFVNNTPTTESSFNHPSI